MMAMIKRPLAARLARGWAAEIEEKRAEEDWEWWVRPEWSGCWARISEELTNRQE